MAQNKNALIRYKTIDKCLQNKYRKWTLNDLIEECSEALFEYEGRDINVSKRSIQLDIQMMRSDKLGYNAPIIVYDRKYYKYEDEDYSITNIPLTENDMSVLSESVEMLKQFKDFSLFSELNGIIQRLEDKVYSEKSDQNAIIHLDKNEGLKGLEHLDTLYQAILKKVCLVIEYQSFTSRASSSIHLTPFILKEYNNRWFVVGRKKGRELLTLALDRIIKIDYDLKREYHDENFNGDEYYRHTVGVSVLPISYLKNIQLKIDRKNAPYVITKPLHHSQQVLEREQDGSIIIEIKVHINYELERLLLGFGSSLEVIKPQGLRDRIKNIFKNGLSIYQDEETS
ncbi:helix-turn-helix transcriptional regulator [Flammeovirga aprica]|uniref:WYL domain-containing protein n=1 Tax=Flammeovirga aprica JL-4 TaxID=694437 RepID=A0A7X9S051_9BACT|nr:WYL domain-containing protein [Flammeovirga aprica]NME71901.1 WYL domain-containing protein [Flammeovirga aprica JL-4]